MPMVPDNGPYPWEQVPELDRRETQYLVFVEIPQSVHGGKTRRWRVESKNSGTLLGRISWYGPWRNFVFYPEDDTLFNVGCLMDINAFMTDAYTDWRLTKERSKHADSST